MRHVALATFALLFLAPTAGFLQAAAGSGRFAYCTVEDTGGRTIRPNCRAAWVSSA